MAEETITSEAPADSGADNDNAGILTVEDLARLAGEIAAFDRALRNLTDATPDTE